MQTRAPQKKQNCCLNAFGNIKKEGLLHWFMYWFKDNHNIFLDYITFFKQGCIPDYFISLFPWFFLFFFLELSGSTLPECSCVLLRFTDNTGNTLEGRQTGRHKEAAYSKTCLVLKGMERSWLPHNIVVTKYCKRETELWINEALLSQVTSHASTAC